MGSIGHTLEQIARDGGATLYGVADLTGSKEYIEETFGDALSGYPRAIVLGIAYPAEVVNQLVDAPTHTYLYYYNVLNSKLDHLALQLAILLQEEGCGAFPVPASQRVSDDRLVGIFSHRMAARLAGLGWIGKNASLVTREYGPRLRLVTVLTDCELETGSPVQNRCGTCNACVEACPPDALTGKPFEPGDQLEERFIGDRCDKHLSKVRSAFGKRICGRCLAVCPWGERRSQR